MSFPWVNWQILYNFNRFLPNQHYLNIIVTEILNENIPLRSLKLTISVVQKPDFAENFQPCSFALWYGVLTVIFWINSSTLLGEGWKPASVQVLQLSYWSCIFMWNEDSASTGWIQNSLKLVYKIMAEEWTNTRFSLLEHRLLGLIRPSS